MLKQTKLKDIEYIKEYFIVTKQESAFEHTHNKTN